MKRVVAYLRRLLDDVVFQRVCTALFTAPFALFGGFMITTWRPTGWEWLLWLIFLVMTVYSVLIFYAAVFASDAKFRRAARYLEDGGHPAALVLIAVVMVVAVPITILIKKLRPRSDAL